MIYCVCGASFGAVPDWGCPHCGNLQFTTCRDCAQVRKAQRERLYKPEGFLPRETPEIVARCIQQSKLFGSRPTVENCVGYCVEG